MPEEPTGAGNQKETAQESLEVQTLRQTPRLPQEIRYKLDCPQPGPPVWSYPFWYPIRKLVLSEVLGHFLHSKFFRPPFTRFRGWPKNCRVLDPRPERRRAKEPSSGTLY